MNPLEELAAEALTWYAAELRTQAEFQAYLMDPDGQRERLDKAAMIDQMLSVRPQGGTISVIEPPPTQSASGPCECNRCIEAEAKRIPVGFARPTKIVGLPRTPWDVV